MSTPHESLDVDAVRSLRSDTPGVESVIHLNNAGSALPPTVVVDAQIRQLRREAEIGGYEAATEAAEEISAVYDSVADLIGARPDQIALAENATRAWGTAVYGYPFRSGDRVITGRSEYASNAIALLQLRRRHGIEIVVVDDDEHGQISLDRLDEEITRGAAMVALTHVPTNGGLVNPAEAVGEICRARDVFFVLDACQSVGQMPIDVNRIGCDVLSATGRKYLRGPRGTGFLYVSDRALETIDPPHLDLHSATWTGPDSYDVATSARRFETFEANYASRLGLGAAVDYARSVGLQPAFRRIQRLAEALRRALTEVDGIDVHDKGTVKCGIVTFTRRDSSPSDLRDSLADLAINVSVSPAEFAQYDLPDRGLSALVRASLHYYNTESELERLVAALDTSSTTVTRSTSTSGDVR